MNTHPTASFSTTRPGLVLPIALLSAGAALADWFAPVIFSGHSLVLGLVFYWIAVRRLGPIPAVPVLLTSWAVLTFKWGQPYSSSLLAIEGLWVGWAWSRRQGPLVADLMFWGLIGTPASWFLYKYVYLIPRPSFEHALVVQVANGLIAVWIAIVVTGFIPLFGPRTAKDSQDSFRGFLLKRYLAFGTIPVLIAGLMAARQYEKSALAEARQNLTTTAENLALTIGNELEKGYDSVSAAAARQSYLVTLAPDANVAKELAAAHAKAANFISMLVADRSGTVIAASIRGESGAIQTANSQQSVADREYFSIPLQTGSGYISDVFQGRGFGRDILFAISAPVINFAGDRTGIVEGSCKVSTLDPLLRLDSPGDSWRVLLTDRKQRVLIGTDFEYPALTPLAGTPLANFIRTPAAAKPGRYTADIQDERISFLSVSVPVPRAGWTVTVQRKWGDILAPITGVYLALIAVALIAALVAVGFTAWSIRDFLSAWSGLLDFARDPVANSGRLDVSRRLNIPREFNDLIDHLSAMAERLKSERNQREQLLAELESRVQTRTQELQTALMAAQAADRAKSAFLATISHELRTPLTSIITGTELLKLTPTARTQMEERTLRTLEKSSQVLMSVISDVLDYSKLEAGSMNITRAPFQPASVVTDVITILNPAAKNAGLSLIAEIGHPPDFEWNGDATHVRQVLVNLVGNAVKFTTAGSVKVSTRITRGAVTRLHFSVQDSGRGIPAEQLDSIFEPFVQLPQDRVLSQGGTGLGLPISRKLVQAMGGEISVSSRPGEGSTFEFWIS